MPDATTFLSAFVTLLVTIGPFEAVGFAFAGKGLLGLLHVSLPAMRTAGGLFLEAIHLMFSAPPGLSSPAAT